MVLVPKKCVPDLVVFWHVRRMAYFSGFGQPKVIGRSGLQKCGKHIASCCGFRLLHALFHWRYNEYIHKIRPHRFGSECVLLGGNSHTKCSITFVNIAFARSALAGEGKNGFAPRPELGGGCEVCGDFWVSELKRVLQWNVGSFW